MEVSRDQQLFGYQHSSKYLLIDVWKNMQINYRIFHFGLTVPLNNDFP